MPYLAPILYLSIYLLQETFSSDLRPIPSVDNVCRKACIDFKKLWKKKHADDLRIQEVAAMQSSLPSTLSFSETSGILLANDITTHDQNNKNNSSKWKHKIQLL